MQRGRREQRCASKRSGGGWVQDVLQPEVKILFSGRRHLLIYKANEKVRRYLQRCGGKRLLETAQTFCRFAGRIPSRTRDCTRSLFVACLNRLFKAYSSHIALATDGVRSKWLHCLLSYSIELLRAAHLSSDILLMASKWPFQAFKGGGPIPTRPMREDGVVQRSAKLLKAPSPSPIPDSALKTWNQPFRPALSVDNAQRDDP